MGNRGSSSHAGGGNRGGRDFASATMFLQRAYGAAHARAIMDIVRRAPAETQELWAEFGSQLKASRMRPGDNGAYYSPRTDSVHLRIAEAAAGEAFYTPYEVVFHEYGHMMDYLIARKMGYSKYTAYSDIFGDGELGRTARQELAAHLSRLSGLYPELGGNHDSLAKVLISEIHGKYYSMLEKGNLSDILEGAGIGIEFPLGVGHGLDYWPTRGNGKEIFAEMTSSIAINPGALKAIQEFFPRTYGVYQRMLKERRRR